MRDIRASEPNTSAHDHPSPCARIQRDHAQTEPGFPREPEPEQGLVERFQAQVERTPRKDALVLGDQRLSYHALNAWVNRLAHRLAAEGVGPEVLVGMVMEHSFAMVAGLLAILKAGGAYLPISPTGPPSRLAFMLADAGVRFLLGGECPVPTPSGVRLLPLLGDWAPPGTPANAPPPRRLPGSLAYVIYTSGTTGAPKGVLVEQQALSGYVAAAISAYGLHSYDRVLQFTPITFDASIDEIFPCLCSGATLVLRKDATVEDARAFINRCEREHLTFVNLPTSYWEQLVEEIDTWGLKLPACVRTIVIGGEAVRRSALLKWWRCVSPSVRLINAYGPTETTVTATTAELGTPLRGDFVPIGRPIGRMQVRVLDPAGWAVPAGEAGELYIGGPQMARGYLGRPSLTAQRFVPDPFSPCEGSRMYRTGDHGRVGSNGLLEYLGRIDLQVKIRGHRVELEEIEAVLKSIPGVCDCTVVLHEVAPGDHALAALVIPAVGQLSAGMLRESLLTRLPSHMVPGQFVATDRIPRTAGGKPDRKAVAEFLAGSHESEREPDVPGPRTPVEERIAEIWSSVLRRERVGVRTSFFELGGHSLLALQAVVRMNDAFGVDLEARDLFDALTVEKIALRVEEALFAGSRVDLPPLRPVSRAGPPNLSITQQRIWERAQLEPGRAADNLTLAAVLVGPLDTTVLAWALDQVEHRHEALRTRFVEVTGVLRPVIEPEPATGLYVVNLEKIAPERRERELRRRAFRLIRRPFALHRAPLLRARLFRLEDDQHVLLLVAHRIVCDEWSLGIMLRDLSRFYFHATDSCPLLEELPVQHADFACWQRGVLEGSTLQASLAYWRKALSGLRPVKSGGEVSRSKGRAPRRGALQWRFPDAVSQDLATLEQSQRMTRSTILLAAFHLLLGRDAGEDDVVVSIPVTGRHGRPEIQLVIGPFGGHVPIRARLRGHLSLEQFARSVRDRVLQAYCHQALPIEAIADSLGFSPPAVARVLWKAGFAYAAALPPDQARLAMRRWNLSLEGREFDIMMRVTDEADAMFGMMTYNPRAFSRAHVRRLIQQYHTLLHRFCLDTEQKLSEVRI